VQEGLRDMRQPAGGAWQPPPHGFGYPRPAIKTSRKAIGALVLAILGVFVAPIVFSTIGIAMAFRARDEIKHSPALRGDGLNKATFVIASICLLLFLALSVLGG
jgi:hypothetical protein